MQKSVIALLFLFSAMIGGYFYLEKTYFFAIDSCLDNGGGWNYEENTCKTWEDEASCLGDNGMWIAEENLCDFGEVIN